MVGSMYQYYTDGRPPRRITPDEWDNMEFDRKIRASLKRIKEEDEAKELKVQERIRGKDSQES